jgi:hypothetical protein
MVIFKTFSLPKVWKIIKKVSIFAARWPVFSGAKEKRVL